MDYSVFISYSHKDAPTVEQVAKAITRAGSASVWMDSRLRGGDNYFSVIANQILESRFFVFIVSENSVISDWCVRELEFAASEHKRIVTIWIGRPVLPPQVKLVIQNTQYINYYAASPDAFFSSVQAAFCQEAPDSSSGHGRSQDQDVPGPQKYFLEEDKLQRISVLLEMEKQSRYSLCFEPENACLLGLAYEMGVGTESDEKKALFYYKISDYYGSYDGKYLYAAARRAKDPDGDPTPLLREMQEAAKHHSTYALTYLGDDYYYGRGGCDKDLDKAYTFWREAAELGSATAMYYMAYGYRRGECVPKDIDLACMYALKAVEHNFPRAFRILAFVYEDGDLGEKDYDKALELYEEAIRRGDFLSLCYEGWIWGQRKDYQKRYALYKQAVQLAEEGKIHSGLPFFRIGYLYEYGEGVSQDLETAIRYYLKGAARKNVSALKYTVSTIMELPDPDKRTGFLQEACQLQCKGAAYELGMLQKPADNTQRLSPLAVEYFTLGAERGEINCMKKLLLEYSLVMGKGETISDRRAALKWFQLFFASLTEEDLAALRKRNLLTTYYYAYAIELDWNADPGLPPDQQMVQFYFRKSLEECPMHFCRIAGFAVDGYLFPDTSSSGLPLDVAHAEELLTLLEGYLSKYYAYLLQSDPDKAADEMEDVLRLLHKGYRKIADCYSTGKTVEKNRTRASLYRTKADNLVATVRKKIAEHESAPF